MAKVSANYEVVYIIDPAQGEEGIAALVAKFKTLAEQNGSDVEVEEGGRRKLADPNNFTHEGYYVRILNHKPIAVSICISSFWGKYFECRISKAAFADKTRRESSFLNEKTLFSPCISSKSLLIYLIGTSLRCTNGCSAICPRGGEWNE